MRAYPKDQSPLYRLTTKRKLAALLGVSVGDLQLLASLQGANYRHWPLPQRTRDKLIGIEPKKKRLIQQPKSLLCAVHKRIGVLLGRIAKPDYVYSATKGRCYVKNAKQHCNEHRAGKVDIKDFYPSVSARRVRRFFEHEMKCAPDVAHLLADLCCADGCLPTGSAISPSLSFFACSDMFAEIAAMAADEKLTFTLYVDDMVFSGDAATRAFTAKVVRVLRRHGFIGHKLTHFRPNSVKVITGVAVWPDRLAIPHARQKRIRAFQEAFNASSDPTEQRILGVTLMGQYREGDRLEPGTKLRALPVAARLAKLPAPVTKPGKKPKPMNLKRSRSSFAALRAKLRPSAPVVT